MYKINEVKLPIDFKVTEESLIDVLSSKTKISKDKLNNVSLNKLSLDARKKDNIHYKANIVFDTDIKLNLSKFNNITTYIPSDYSTPKWVGDKKNIIIVGSGPSGLFAGLKLCNSGQSVTIIERGYEMSKRKMAVENMMNNGMLDEKSNIQFGEGGAGTFSDGKLNTGTGSPLIGEVLHTFCQYGASNEIMYSNKPHIGTDVLSGVIVNIREYMKSKGCTFLWEHRLTKINDNSTINVDTPNGLKVMPFDILIMAVGHSSRDTIRSVYASGMEFKNKPFSLGFRIEHLKKDIDYSQYGEVALRGILPPADYHLSTHLPNGRCVYTFCMCPGGVVVPATSECGHVVTNGMSYSIRDGVNSNSALLVSVTPDDFPSNDILSGIELQEKIEKYAFEKTNSYKCVVQSVGDFLAGVPTTKLGRVTPTYKPGFVLGSVEDVLPVELIDSLKLGIKELDKKLHGFASPDAILSAVETRSSAPYQVIRNEFMESSIKDVYMIGEGAGMAGGIVSSAVEGLKVANILIKKYNNQ